MSLIAKDFLIRRFKRSDYEECLDAFIRFQKDAEVKIMSIDFKFSKSLGSKKDMLKKQFDYFALDKKNENYIAVDKNTNKIVCFYCFQRNKNRAIFKLNFKNPDFLFSPKIIEITKKVIKEFCKKNNISELYSELHQRNNYSRYVKFVQKHFAASIITENKDFILVKHDLSVM